MNPHKHIELANGAVANVAPGASRKIILALSDMAKRVVPTRDCWRCFGAVEVEPRGFTEKCPFCNADDPHGSPPEKTKAK